MDVGLMIIVKMSQPTMTAERSSRLFAGTAPRRRKRRGDKVVERDGKRLRYSGIGRAAYWYNALRLSPSYELARRVRAGNHIDPAKLPADFATVLAVYDDLGDVTLDLDVWTSTYAFRAFGEGGVKPAVVSLGIGSHGNSDPFSSSKQALDAFQSGAWIEQGERTTLIAAIPVGMTKAQILKQVMALLETLPPSVRDTSPVAPKYKITATPHILSSARKYLRCLEMRATNPKLTLWQIGERTKLSSVHDGFLKRKNKPNEEEILKARKAIKETTSRAINRGHMIAENAARGIFPSYAKCPDAVAIDWADLGKRLG